jgi:hypothetical protein
MITFIQMHSYSTSVFLILNWQHSLYWALKLGGAQNYLHQQYMNGRRQLFVNHPVSTTQSQEIQHLQVKKNVSLPED